MSFGNGTGTVREGECQRQLPDSYPPEKKGRKRAGREKRTSTRLDHHIIHRLRHIRQPVELLPLLLERDHQPAVVVAHLRQLRGDLPGQLDAVLERRVRLERLALDLLEQVRAAAQELVVGELPGLHVGRRALRTRGL